MLSSQIRVVVHGARSLSPSMMPTCPYVTKKPDYPGKGQKSKVDDQHIGTDVKTEVVPKADECGHHNEDLFFKQEEKKKLEEVRRRLKDPNPNVKKGKP